MTDNNTDQYRYSPAKSTTGEFDLSPGIGNLKPTKLQIQSLSADLDTNLNILGNMETLVISDPEELGELTSYLRSIPGFNNKFRFSELLVGVNEDSTFLIGRDPGNRTSFDIRISGLEKDEIIERVNEHPFKALELYKIGKITTDLLKLHNQTPDHERQSQLVDDFISLVDSHPLAQEEFLGTPARSIRISREDQEYLPRLLKMEESMKSRGILRQSDKLLSMQYLHWFGNADIGFIDFKLELPDLRGGETPGITILIGLDQHLRLTSNVFKFGRHGNRGGYHLELQDKIMKISNSTISRTKLALLREANRVLSDGQAR